MKMLFLTTKSRLKIIIYCFARFKLASLVVCSLIYANGQQTDDGALKIIALERKRKSIKNIKNVKKQKTREQKKDEIVIELEDSKSENENKKECCICFEDTGVVKLRKLPCKNGGKHIERICLACLKDHKKNENGNLCPVCRQEMTSCTCCCIIL